MLIPDTVSVMVFVEAPGSEFESTVPVLKVNPEPSVEVTSMLSFHVRTIVVPSVCDAAVIAGTVVSSPLFTDCAVKSARSFVDDAASVTLVPEFVYATFMLSASVSAALSVSWISVVDTAMLLTVIGPFARVPVILKSLAVAPTMAMFSVNVTSTRVVLNVAALSKSGAAPSVAAVPVKLARVFPSTSATPLTCAIVGVTPVSNGVVYVSVTTLPDTPIVPSVLKAVESEV